MKNLLEINDLNVNKADISLEASPVSQSEKIIKYPSILSKDQKLKRFKSLGKISKEDDGRIIDDEIDAKTTITWTDYMKAASMYGHWSNLLAINLLQMGISFIRINITYKMGQMAEVASSSQDKYSQLIFSIICMALFQTFFECIRGYTSEIISDRCM